MCKTRSRGACACIGMYKLNAKRALQADKLVHPILKRGHSNTCIMILRTLQVENEVGCRDNTAPKMLIQDVPVGSTTPKKLKCREGGLQKTVKCSQSHTS